jgi:phenylalanyl-tRNA synthetase beta chain
LQTPNTVELEISNIQQEPMLAGVVYGDRQTENWSEGSQAIDFYDVKGDVESVIALSGDQAHFQFEKGVHPALHPGQTAVITRNAEPVGYLGLIDPRVAKSLGLEQNAYLFEVKLSGLASRRVPQATNLSKFPEVRRDIAVIVDKNVSAAEIGGCVKSVEINALQNLKLFDVYQGEGIDLNRKSIALGLTFQDASRTLTDDEINDFVAKIIEALSTQLGASLRN